MSNTINRRGEIIANKYYKSDIAYAFQMNRFFLRIIGMWPFMRTNAFLPQMVEFVVVSLICMILLLIEFIPAVLYIFVVIKDLRLRVKIMGATLFTMITIIKYCYMLLYRREISSCLMLIDEDWRNVVDSTARISMIDRIKIGRRLFVTCSIFACTAGFAIRVIVPLASGKIVTPQNTTIRQLPLVAHFVFFDVQRSPVYEILFALQTFIGFIKYTIIIAIFSFIIFCSMHFCAQLDILMTLMNNFVNESECENLDKKLAILVEHQIRTRNFLKLMKSVIQYPNLIEVFGSTLTICLAGYYIIMEWENQNMVRLISYILAIATFLFHIFIYCYMGEQVIGQGEKVALTARTLEWYRLSDAHARGLILIMAISETPLKITAGKFIELSFRTFGNIIKMAMTYFNVLRSTE